VETIWYQRGLAQSLSNVRSAVDRAGAKGQPLVDGRWSPMPSALPILDSFCRKVEHCDRSARRIDEACDQSAADGGLLYGGGVAIAGDAG
jgi:hypothetical protein